ncbi:MAG TPA: HEAT repeat domain-containing protein [Kofleriaceae bacterium]|jgi:tetratricopeptide (TPR) repeat protein
MRRLPFLLAAALSFAAPGIQRASADDWGVTRDPFDKNVVARYRKILASNPHDGTALAKLLDMYRRYRTVDALKDELQKTLDKSPDDVPTLIVLGRLNHMTGDDVRALDMWQRAVAKKDTEPQTWLYIGELQKSANKNKEARAAYDKALAQSTSKDMKKKALRSLADLALATADNEGANEYFKQFLALDPTNAQLWIERGDAMLAAGKRDIALDSYASAEKLLGGDPAKRMEVVARRGQALEGMGKDDEAVAEYKRAIKLAPKGYYLETELTGRIIEIYRRKQALPALLAEYEKAWPEGSRGHFEWDTLGKLYEETGQQDKAIAALKKAVAKSSSELETQRHLITLLENSGRDDEALAQYETVVRIAPGEASFQIALAERYWGRGKEKQAIEALARLQNRFPNDAGVISSIADMYQRWGKDAKAIEMYELLARLEPEDPGHLVTLGEQYWVKGDNANKAKATAVWKRLLTSGKAVGFAKYAEVMAEHGNRDEALANYNKAISLEEKKAELYKGRAGVFDLMKKWDLAIKDWEKVLELTGSKPTDRLARTDARKHIVQLITRTPGVIQARRGDWEKKFAGGDVEAGYFLVELYKSGKAPQAGEPLGTLQRLHAKVADDQELTLDLVKEYRKNRQYDQAVATLQELAVLAPSREREVDWTISEIMREARKDDEALVWQQKALAKNPTDATAYQRMAEAFVEMQRFDEAIAAYEKAVQLDPRASKAEFALSQLYVQGGQPMKAAEILRTVLRTASDEEVVGRAGREAIDLEEMTDTLGELEKVLSPLSFMMAHKQVYRRVLVDLYLRYVPRLVDRERHGNDEVKKAARAELARIGGHGLQPLLEALRDEKDANQQRVAVAVLGHLGNKGAAQPLVRMARQEPPKDQPRKIGTLTENVEREVRIAALVAAGRLGDPSVLDDVLPLITHTEVAMREAATFTVGRTADKRAVAPLIERLADSRGSVQALACLGLGRIDDPRVAPALIGVLADARRDDTTRAAAAYALGMRKAATGIPALLAALDDNRGEAQRLSAWALGQIGDNKALGPLIRAYFARAGRADAELVWAIGRTSNAGLAPLVNVGANEYPQRGDKYNVVDAIGDLPGPLAAPAPSAKLVVDHAADIAAGLTSALTEHRDVVVSVLADLDGTSGQLGLGALTPPTGDAKLAGAYASISAAIEPQVRTQLASDDPKVRALAVSVYAKIDGGKVSADSALAKALTDPSELVRGAAMDAVATLAQRRGTAPAELVGALGKTLANGAWADRRTAAMALGRLGASGDPAALAKAAGDSSSFVREAVAQALGPLTATTALEPLLTLSRDEVAQVRAAAAKALGQQTDPRAQHRRQELASDSDPTVRAAAN